MPAFGLCRTSPVSAPASGLSQRQEIQSQGCQRPFLSWNRCLQRSGQKCPLERSSQYPEFLILRQEELPHSSQGPSHYSNQPWGDDCSIRLKIAFWLPFNFLSKKNYFF